MLVAECTLEALVEVVQRLEWDLALVDHVLQLLMALSCVATEDLLCALQGVISKYGEGERRDAELQSGDDDERLLGVGKGTASDEGVGCKFGGDSHSGIADE